MCTGNIPRYPRYIVSLRNSTFSVHICVSGFWRWGRGKKRGVMSRPPGLAQVWARLAVGSLGCLRDDVDTFLAVSGRLYRFPSPFAPPLLSSALDSLSF